METLHSETMARLRRVERLLRECREENRRAFELAGVGQAHGDGATGRFLRVNQAFCKMMGYSAEELLQLTVRDISHPEDREIFFEAYPRMLCGEITEYAADKRYIHKNGSIIWVSIHASLLPRRAGEPQRVVAVIEDITARKKAEAAALESATRFRAIFEHSLDAIALYKHTTHALVNSAYARLFGYETAEELIGTPSLALIAPSERAAIHDRIIRKLRGEPVPTYYVSRGLRKDGTEFDLEIHSSMFDLASERFRLVILRDVTERNRIARELSESRSELERRVRERTYDLVRVNERLERESRRRRLLERKIREITYRERRQIGQDIHDGLGQQLVGTIYMVNTMIHDAMCGTPATAEKLGELARNLAAALSHAREISHGLFPVELEEEGFLCAMRHLTERVERSCGIRCAFTCPDDVVIGKDAAIQLYRITQEALANAVKHGRPAEISVELSVRNQTMQLVISDNGIGISPDAKGGIGLSSMRDRARLLDGSVRVRRNPAGGTTVTCSIPRPSPPHSS